MTTSPVPSDLAGRNAAFIVYTLYLLSIPSAGAFALLGVIVALVSRDGAAPLARSHLDDQVGVWFTAFWWAVGLIIVTIVGWLLAPILIGIPILWLAWVGGLLIGLWFTVKSILGLLALLDYRPR